MMKAKKKASLPRKAVRRRFLEKAKQKIRAQVENFRDDDLYRVLLRLLDKELALSQSGIGNNEFPEILWEDRERVFRFFCEVARSIRQFQNSKKEGKVLFAKLLKWVVGKIVEPYLENF